MDQLSKDLIQLSSEYLTKSEVLSSYKKIIAQILKVETALVDKFNQFTNNFNNKFSNLEDKLQTNTDDLNNFKAKFREMRDGRDGLDGIQGERGAPGRDGKDADETKIIQEVLNKIKLPENKISIEDIEGLKEELEKMETNKRLGGVGGGLSKIALESKFIDDETPTGLINGVNTDFVLANNPNPATSLKVYVNGQRLRITEDYTFSNRTITLLTAPPTDSILLVDYRK